MELLPLTQVLMTQQTIQLAVRDLGRMAYADALLVQEQTHQAVLEEASGPVILLVEHDPVITVGKRKSSSENVLASPEALKTKGIDLQLTNRGGDVTYHGPGQLVAYPILRLADYGLNVGRYMRLLEQVVIDALEHFDIQTHRLKGMTGVWAGRDQKAEKICAMGVRIRRNVSMHGLALNVDCDMSHFDVIIPCGIRGHGVTSMAKLLEPGAPSMSEVKPILVDAMNQRLADTLR